MSEQQKDVFVYERVVNTGKYQSRKIGLHKVNDTGLPLHEFAAKVMDFVDNIASRFEEQVNEADPPAKSSTSPASAMAPTSRKKYSYKDKQ